MNSSKFRRTAVSVASLTTTLIVFLLAGCVSPASTLPSSVEPGPQTLQAGDVLKVSYAGAPNLETTQQIRRDGFINLAMVGEVKAEGKTTRALEQELGTLYASQLVSKEIKVTVVSSSFAVFVTGAVIRPGKIQPDHRLTAFEAIMEAGGFDYAKANPKAVRIIRVRGTSTESFTLNLQAVLDGKSMTQFYLESNDTVYVPEKFQWF